MNPAPQIACPRCGEAMSQDAPCPLCSPDAGANAGDPAMEPNLAELNGDTLPLPAASSARSFGHYELTGEIARGGMGVVYRARDTVLDCAVALKVINARFSAEPEARARFLREARAAAQLRHPHIASVFHYGEQDGQCFYAMELVEGETLEARVRRDGPLPPKLALAIIRQIVQALTAAEARGVVHRDLKPANLMLSEAADVADGEISVTTVKVIDFGLVKALAATDSPEQLTHHGFVGTPAYASPEQFSAPLGESDSGAGSQGIDARSDIYSLGVTLWYALTGKVPYAGRNFLEVRDRRAHQPLPLEHLRAARVPAGVVTLLREMLAPDPANRPQTARALLGQLDLCRKLDEAGHPAARTRPSWGVVAGGVAALLALAAVAAWHFGWNRQAPLAVPPPAPLSAALRELPPLDEEKSVAVLPLENLSADPANAFFADGVHEDVITALAKIRGLKIIGRASVMGYRGALGAEKLREVGRTLGVRSLLEGSVRRAGERVVVTVRLVEASTGRQLWAESYDRTERDAITLQGEIAREIATALRITLSPGEESRLARPPTADPDAYALYLRGDALFRTRSVADVRQAQPFFEQAIKLDPAFALARARLAVTWVFLQLRLPAEYSLAQLQAKALPLVQEALRLQPDLAEAHRAFFVLSWRTGDNVRAMEEIQIAVRLAPNDGDVLGSLGFLYNSQGRYAETRAVRERAVELNPQDAYRWQELSDICSQQRDWPATIRAVDRWGRLKPANFRFLYLSVRAEVEFFWKEDLEPLRAFDRNLPAAEASKLSFLRTRAQIALMDRDYAAGESAHERAIGLMSAESERPS